MLKCIRQGSINECKTWKSKESKTTLVNMMQEEFEKVRCLGIANVLQASCRLRKAKDGKKVEENVVSI